MANRLPTKSAVAWIFHVRNQTVNVFNALTAEDDTFLAAKTSLVCVLCRLLHRQNVDFVLCEICRRAVDVRIRKEKSK